MKILMNIRAILGSQETLGNIYRFRRDVTGFLQRIHAKNAALGTDLGRDLNSALALFKKHEAQLQVLVKDASKLQKYIRIIKIRSNSNKL